MTTKKDEELTPFHSAVNRIPVLRTSAARVAKACILPESLIIDGPAPGHDHLDPKRWSGSIDLEMTVRTPLVFGEQTTENGRSCIDLPTDEQDNPLVPPTMVKGMISRAYENLTCSRFRVFGDAANQSNRRRAASTHSERLTYRGDPASALQLIPVRLTQGTPEDGFKATLLQGDTRNQDDYREGRYTYPTMMAASLQAGNQGNARLILKGGIERLNRMTRHQRTIRCRMTLCLHGDRGRGARYAYWQVTEIFDDNTKEYEKAFQIKEHVTTIEDMDDIEGYVYRTTADGDAPRQLFDRKHDERVFFDVSHSGPEEVLVSPAVCDAYRIVVESYVTQRTDEASLNLPKNKRHRPNRVTDEALEELRDRAKKEEQRNEKRRNALKTGAPLPEEPDLNGKRPLVELKVGHLAYAVTKENRDGSHTVLELLPIMVGRRAYEMSPRELAINQGVTPISCRNGASPADRLFGYVIPSANENATGGDVAARGRITIGRVTAVDSPEDTICRHTKELTPLLSPKPQSARRFLTDASGKTPYGKDNEDRPAALPRHELFRQGQLLGAAAYPVHRRLLEGKDLDFSGFPREATKAVALNEREQDNSAVRLKVRSWVKAGCILRCTLSFSNLEKDELAALLWILTPENLVPLQEKGDSGAVGYLRMGLGKPLGLGAIEVRVADNGLRASTGAELAARYGDLSGCLDEATPTVSVMDFPLPKEDLLLKTPWVRAMQRAAFGYTDGYPVRHMSLEENKANNMTDSKTGRPKEGCGVAPVDMTGEDHPQPITMNRDKYSAGHKSAPRTSYGR